MKVRSVKNLEHTGFSSGFNTHAMAEIFVGFDDGDYTTDFMHNYEVLLSNGAWKNLSDAFKDKDVIPDNYNCYFREPANLFEKNQGYYLCFIIKFFEDFVKNALLKECECIGCDHCECVAKEVWEGAEQAIVQKEEEKRCDRCVDCLHDRDLPIKMHPDDVVYRCQNKIVQYLLQHGSSVEADFCCKYFKARNK
jgi:hypothetical protein